MSFTPTIEQKGDLLVASIGLAGFDSTLAEEKAEVSDFLRRPVAKKFGILGALIDADFSFIVGFTGPYNKHGQIINHEDYIRVLGSSDAGGRKIVAGTIEVDFVGTKPLTEIIGVSRVLADLGHPLEKYYNDLPENIVEDDDFMCITLPCTIEQTGHDRDSVLRFNLLSAIGQIDTELACLDDDHFDFTRYAVYQSGLSDI